MVLIQRSCGYSWRPTLTISEVKEVIDAVKGVNPQIICFVDNCFGEFVERLEPTHVGADLIAGSLIKNCGEREYTNLYPLRMSISVDSLSSLCVFLESERWDLVSRIGMIKVERWHRPVVTSQVEPTLSKLLRTACLLQE